MACCCCLRADCGPEHAGLMLSAARAALAHPGPCRFVVAQDQRGASGLAKTLHLEAPAVPVTVVTAPLANGLTEQRAAELAAAIAADVTATAGFSEVHYDESGTRRVPLLRPVTQLSAGDGLPVGPGDVLLVSGGGKGITAECALALGRQTGAAVAILGRSDPAADAELAANLGRLAAAGIRYRYIRADVTSTAAVASAVAQVSADLGAVTAVLHGAGRNEPAALTSLDEDAFRRTVAPKIAGLEAILAAVDPAALKLLVSFASIIGRAGLRGQADYATANDWLTDLTVRFAESHPQCRCISLEWSVWAGAGMGERLGVLESLTREGISPIAVDDGIDMLLRILASPQLPPALVVMGRAGGLPTITLEPRDLPLARFIDRASVHYPGIELVADTELSADSDPYLADHLLDGDLLFPAVLGMEAMAQAGAVLAGTALAGAPRPAGLREHGVSPPDRGATRRHDHDQGGRAAPRGCRRGRHPQQRHQFPRGSLPRDAPVRGRSATFPPYGQWRAASSPTLALDPATDLYGGIFFQGKRFQRVAGYRQLSATSCAADIVTLPGDGWFAAYLPAELQLGDPGARDAFMHAIQSCVPDATLLPAGVERLYAARPEAAGEQVTLHAVRAGPRRRHLYLRLGRLRRQGEPCRALGGTAPACGPQDRRRWPVGSRAARPLPGTAGRAVPAPSGQVRDRAGPGNAIARR